jgi:endo-1,3(4)-beta-glucanase
MGSPRFVILKGKLEKLKLIIKFLGKKGKVTTFEGGTYILYVIDGTIDVLSLLTDGVTLTSTTPFTGTIRLAKMFESSQEAILDAHSETYPVGVDMKYDVTGDVSTMTWNWEVVGDPNNLLVLCWPHHR